MASLWLMLFAALNGIDLPPVGSDLLPQPPTMAAGLPEAEKKDGGTWLPTPLDQAVADMLQYCQGGYARVCATAIGEARRVEGAVCEGQISVLNAQCAEGKLQQAIDASQGWSVAKVVAVVGIAAILGIGTGYLLGRVTP